MFGINELSWTPFPASILFNATQKTFNAEVSNISASAGKTTNNVKWYASSGTYWTQWGGSGGYSATCGPCHPDTHASCNPPEGHSGCNTVAKYLESPYVKSRHNAGQGFNFLTLGPQDTFADDGTGGRSITPCADPNRKTNTDGSCGADCKDGYEPNTAPNSSSECIAVANDDPNDCATANRAKNTDDTCGDCKTGYSEDTTTGLCVADVADEEDAPNYLLYGGIAVAGLIAFTMMEK